MHRPKIIMLLTVLLLISILIGCNQAEPDIEGYIVQKYEEHIVVSNEDQILTVYKSKGFDLLPGQLVRIWHTGNAEDTYPLRVSSRKFEVLDTEEMEDQAIHQALKEVEDHEQYPYIYVKHVEGSGDEREVTFGILGTLSWDGDENEVIQINVTL